MYRIASRRVRIGVQRLEQRWNNENLVRPLLLSPCSRPFSDRLLGHSPMAPTSPSQQDTNYIPTAKDVTTSGGVWAPTSAKRDKLAELKAELENEQQTLDDMATELQKLHLWLADGIQDIVKTTDSAAADSKMSVIADMDEYLNQTSSKLADDLHQGQWEEHLRDVSKTLDTLLATLPADRYLRNIRDFMDPSQVEEDVVQSLDTSSSDVNDNFSHAVLRFRLLVTRAAAETLQESWKTLTTVSDQDVDRAAVKGEHLDHQASTLPKDKLHSVLRAYLQGTCSDRVDAMWDLMDRDQDGLLNEAEMNQVCQLAIQPVQSALETIMMEALNAYPVRAPLPEEGTETKVPVPAGWRQRRKEAKEKKRLIKMFQKTLRKHFEDEVEMPHRLRCIYAWANKAHQDNKIDSVMVEEEGWSGRQRYVELNPKISLPEFREVQQEHFTHLDRVGAECLKSFREDLWVAQGKGRQSRELMRDCALFLTVVCFADYIIMSL